MRQTKEIDAKFSPLFGKSFWSDFWLLALEVG